MGQNRALLVGVGGALATTAIGLGPAPGFAIGTLIGSQIFPPKGPTTEGPRLGELAVSSSTFGTVIPKNFGTIRTNGNMIWTSGIREQKNKDKVGGKGGSSPTSTTITYTYFASFALSFGAGEAVDVLRMWADGKLIFDKLTAQGIDPNNRFQVVGGVVTPTTSVSTTYEEAQSEGLFFRFYPGSTTQEPDSLIQSVEGAANTPAFRGLCYIVFDDIPLRNYGNRIPNITAEITYGGTQETTNIPVTELAGQPLTGQWDTSDFAVDAERGFVYMRDAVGGLDETGLRKFNLRTMTEVAQILAEDMGDPIDDPIASSTTMVVAPDGFLILFAAGGNSGPIYRVDPVTLRIVKKIGSSNSGFGYKPGSFEQTQNAVPFTLLSNFGRRDYILCHSIFNSVMAFDAVSLDVVFSTDQWTAVIPPGTVFVQVGSLSEISVRSVCPGPTRTDRAEAYFFAGDNYNSASSDDLNFYRATISPEASFGLTSAEITLNFGGDIELIRAFAPADLFPGETDIEDVSSAVFDEVDETVVFWITLGSDANDHRLIKVNTTNGDVIWRSPMLTTHPSNKQGKSNNRLRNSIYGFVFAGIGYEIDLTDGSIIQGPLSFPGTNQATSGAGFYDSFSRNFFGIQSITVPFRRYVFARNPGGLANMDEVIEGIAGLVDVPSTDLDVTAVSTVFAQGYSISRQMSARAAMEPWNNLFYADGIESDFLLKWKLRGQAAVRSIPFSDLIVTNQQLGQVLQQNVTQEVELPRRYTVSFLDAETDYEQGTQSATRALEPLATMQSRNNLGIQFGGSLPSALAKQQAEKGLFTAWSERTSLSGRYSWKHLELDPTDVVNITARNGDIIRCRLIEGTIGDNLTINFVGIQESLQLFESTVVGNKGSGFVAKLIARARLIETILLDSPLLRDEDEPAGRAFVPVYALMGTLEGGGFVRGTLMVSPDDSEYTVQTSVVSEMDWGTTLNALGDPPDGNPHQTDNTNTISVQMVNGGSDLESITNAQLLAGGNACAIIKANGEVEIIQFQTVTAEADGTFTLSVLLRGRRGTDTMAFSHTSNERIVRLIPVDIVPFTVTLSAVDVTRFYKSLGPDTFIEDAFATGFASTGRPLMPYAPVQESATLGASDSIDFAWERRARLGVKGSQPLPLSEDTEEYELDILDMPGGTVVRTVTGLTTPAHNYTSAEQTTDGFTPPLSSITISVYQISAQVGRGFSREITLPVL